MSRSGGAGTNVGGAGEEGAGPARPGVALHVSEDVDGDVLAEGAIALELRFAEELVSRQLVGERRVIDDVVADIGRLVAGERGLT